MLLSAFTILFFMNCGQNAEFTNDEQFKSLVDGETVEVVPNDEFDAMNNEGDSGIISTDGTNGGMGTGHGGTGGTGGTTGGTNTGDGGLTGDGTNGGMGTPDDTYTGPGNSGSRDGNAGNGNGNNGNGNGGKNGHTCKERLVEQDNKKQHADMITSPEEMETDDDMYAVSKCGNGKEKKVQVCHFPNADYSKRKTLCIGRPALEAHVAHLGAQRGTEHVDYAGPCKDNDGNIADGEHHLRGEDKEESEPAETASFDFSGRQ